MVSLFADTPAGADASAIHYSLVETAKTHGLEPYAYLNAVFKALPYADTVQKIEDLLPWNFKKSQPNGLPTHVQQAITCHLTGISPMTDLTQTLYFDHPV